MLMEEDALCELYTELAAIVMSGLLRFGCVCLQATSPYTDDEERLCVICLVNERNTTVLPCRWGSLVSSSMCVK